MLKRIITVFLVLIIQISASTCVFSCDKHDSDKTTSLEDEDNE